MTALLTLDTERAIHFAKESFEKHLASTLGLTKITSPAFFSSTSGVQDNLSGIERPVSFTVKEVEGEYYEIIHSLAKWKRQALARYQVSVGEGIYTDMRALRPDEEDLRSSIHSVYVDQWDWEKVIRSEDRTIGYLMSTVRDIYRALTTAEKEVAHRFALTPFLPTDISFVQSEELVKRWPDLSPKARENKICEEKGAVFVIGIGAKLSDGKKHDGRAPDYDDWLLNGDILIWNPVLERAFEISSMGIRVNKEVLLYQLELADCMSRLDHPWHQDLVEDKMPLSIGGGIGQSRTVMLLLQKRHIGEVHAGTWPKDVREQCQAEGISLL